MTQVGTVSPEDVRAEQKEQLRLAAELEVANQQRVGRLAAPLLRAAAPLCARGAGHPSKKKRTTELVAPIIGACPFRILVPRQDELNAAADGSKIYVATAMLRFASDDELSVVLAHEIAHNAMRHRDAQTKNALGGALLGAIADIAMAAGGKNTGGQYSKMGAEAGAQAFSQDFEREADYVGMYILAWAGRPLASAAGFWRRMAVEHPTGIVFATTHPTTAERFVRLEQWAREVDLKLASGDAFGPEMKDSRLRVASRPITAPRGAMSSGDVALAATSERSSPPPLGVDAGRPATAAQSFATAATTRDAAKALQPTENRSAARQIEPIVPASDDERYARATIGAPRSEDDRAAAVPAYERGMAYLGTHDWGRAKAELQKALRLDGSLAAYHAALGEVLLVEEDWAGAAAEYTAALLIDVDNQEYRARLKEARSRR
jgi:predicted Zn-dependent protease